MFIAERERLEKIQQNVSLGDKIRSMSDEQLARFLTGQKDGEEFVAKLEELRTKQNTPLHQNSSY